MAIYSRRTKYLIGVAALSAILFSSSNSSRKILLFFVGSVDNLLDFIQDGQKYNDLKHHPLFLKSPNWFPLSENEIRDDSVTELELVVGNLPSDIDGVALRIGPNASPDMGFNKKLNAIIDGDGMLHSIRLDGRQRKKALYSSGWIDTPRRQFELELGRGFFLRLGELKGIVGILKLLLMPLKVHVFGKAEVLLGQANTAMVTFENRLYCLQENSLPFEVDLKEDGSFESVGYRDFDGVLDYPFGAHPRVDPESKEMFFMGYNPFGKPAMKWGVITPSSHTNGKSATVTKYFDVESPYGGTPFAHDFAITKNYVLLLDNSVRFDFSNIMNGEALKLDEKSPLRFGICPRNSSSINDIMWYSHQDALALIHFVNAWEEGNDKLVLWAPIWSKFVGDVVNLDDDPAEIIRMTEFTFDLNDPQRRIKTRDVERETHHSTAVDFPTVNANFVGRKTECAFAGIMKRNVVDFDGISMWRPVSGPTGGLEKNVFYGDGITGGEPIIAPKVGRGKQDSCAVYVLNYIYDSNASESFLVIYDGEAFGSEPVAKYRLPHRIPSGLHAAWVDAEALSPTI